MADFISTYRTSVRAAVNPVVAYIVASFGSMDALLRYSVCPLNASGALAETLAETAFVFMGNVVARGDFNPTHPEWAEACKLTTPRITSAGLGGQSRDEAELRRLQANVALAIPTGWVARAIASAKLTSAPVDTVTPVADSVADAVAATLQPEATADAEARKDAERAQIDAAVAKAQGPRIGRPKRR